MPFSSATPGTTPSGTTQGTTKSPTAPRTPLPAARGTSKLPPVIDHMMFPHIIDRIVDDAPHDLLLALRGTSRAFCDRVDDILCRHLVLPSDGFPILLPSGSRFPLLEPFGQDNSGEDHDAGRLGRLLSRARVIELLDDIGEDSFWATAGAPDRFAAVHTLKLHPPLHPPKGTNDVYKGVHRWFPNIKTFVSFTNVYLDRFSAHMPLLDVHVMRPPDSVERAVFTVRIDDDKYYESTVVFQHPLAHYRSQSLREMVFIFDHSDFEDDWASTGKWGQDFTASKAKWQAAGWQAGDWLRLIDFKSPSLVQYTFVDMPHTNEACLRHAAASTRDYWDEEYRERIEDMFEMAEDSLSDEEVARRVAAVEFISRSEYAARVGDEQFKFEWFDAERQPDETRTTTSTSTWRTTRAPNLTTGRTATTAPPESPESGMTLSDLLEWVIASEAPLL